VSASQLGWVAVWLFVGSSVVIVIELAVAGFWSMRLARRGRALSVALQAERAFVKADVERLRATIEETRVLWLPYSRVLLWLRHPLVVALIGYYRRRI